MTKGTGRAGFAQHPLLILGIAFASGIVFEHAATVDTRLLFILTLACILCGVLIRGHNSLAATLLIAAAFFVSGAICSRSEKLSIGPDRLRTLIDSGELRSGEPVELEGRLFDEPEPAANAAIIWLDVENLVIDGRSRPASGHVRILTVIADEESASEFEKLDLRYGSSVAIACIIVREEEFQNPGVPSRLDLLDRQALDATATIKSPLLIEKLVDEASFYPLSAVYRSRRWLIEEFRSRYSASTAGVLTASMLGDRYFLDKTIADTFREGGTFHVLVISGLHITFIGGILLLFVRLFARKRATQFVIVSTALWLYTLAVGADVPVVRASMMFTILFFSRVIYRQGSLLNALGACVIVLLVWRPSDIFSPSLQLTIASVASIVAMAFPLIEKLRAIGSWVPTAAKPFPPNAPKWLRRFCETLYWRPAFWQIESSRQIWSARIFKSPYFARLFVRGGQKYVAYLFEGLLVSFIVQLWLLPFVVIYFHRVTPVSVVMNLWVGVVMAAENFAALAAVAFGHISETVAGLFVSLTEFCNYLLATLPARLNGGGWVSWRVPNYSGGFQWVYAIYYLPVVVLTASLWHWNAFEISNLQSQIKIFVIKCKKFDLNMIGLMITALLAIVIVFHPLSAQRPDGRLRVDFIDVGQGDSAFVTFPDGTTMLIDGGGRIEFNENDDDDGAQAFTPDVPGIGEAVVSPVLWNKGYSHIDYILATHADADHVQGLMDVAVNFDVGQALFGRKPAGDPEFEALTKVLTRRNITSAFIARGQVMRLGGASVEVLYPLGDTSPEAVSDNDHSVVVRIVYGTRAFLFTGDIERGAESELVNGGGVLRSDIVKVPHHGSRTSSTPEFIDAVRPKYAIISVGRHSLFGHPHADVVERWQNAGAKVLTTGERGMISVSTDGRDLAVTTFP